MHAIPYAAWVALVSIVGSVAPGAAPLDAAAELCEPPACVRISHNLLMNPPVTSVAEGAVVEWRTLGAHHWIVESGDDGGCLSFSLSEDRAYYRVSFLASEGVLYAIHKVPSGDFVPVACRGAFELPNGLWALRYSCALHGRAGGVGLLLVAAAPPELPSGLLP